MSETWIFNPKWIGRVTHGTLTRRGPNLVGKLPFGETITRAAPYLRELVNPPSQFTIIGADQVHGFSVAANYDQAPLPKSCKRQTDLVGIETFEFAETDGLVTTFPNHLLLLQTADCLPILYFDPASRMVGACHCGWRGLFGGLAHQAARVMIRIGANPETLEAWIGPGIRAENYEVGAELVGKFQSAFPQTLVSPDGTHLDLARIATGQLLAAGLDPSRVTDSGECTFANPDLYYSYRREGANAGRLLTVIGFVSDPGARR